MRFLFCGVVLISFLFISSSFSFINKDSGMPPYVMVELLEWERPSLSELEELYLSFQLVRHALSEHTALVRDASQRMIDAYLDCLKKVASKTPVPVMQIKSFYTEFKALHFFMRRGVGYYLTSTGQKLDLVRPDQYVQLLEHLEKILQKHQREAREDRLPKHKLRVYGEVYLTALLLGNSLIQCNRLILSPKTEELIDVLALYLRGLIDDRSFGTEYHPHFCYLLREGVTNTLKLRALVYFITIYPDKKTFKMALEFAEAHVNKDDPVVESILLRLIDKTPDVLEAVGRINEKIKDIPTQQRITQAMNKHMDFLERQSRVK